MDKYENNTIITNVDNDIIIVDNDILVIIREVNNGMVSTIWQCKRICS
jgi:hypothetical protein